MDESTMILRFADSADKAWSWGGGEEGEFFLVKTAIRSDDRHEQILRSGLLYLSRNLV